MKFDDLIRIISANVSLLDDMISDLDVNEDVRQVLSEVLRISSKICERKEFFRENYDHNTRYCDYYESTMSLQENADYYGECECSRKDDIGFLLYIYGQTLVFLNQLLKEQELLTLIDDDYLNDLQYFVNRFDKFVSDNKELIEMSSNELQCIHGKNIIVFFKEEDDSDFLIECDLANVSDYKSASIYLKSIMNVLNENNYCDLNQARFSNFRSPIRGGREKNSKPISFLSEFSSRNCMFSRLKSPRTISDRMNNIRLSCVKIDLCEENKAKLGVDSNTVVLILGAAEIKNINLHSEYGYFIKQLNCYQKKIQAVVKMFEDPTTPVEELTAILSDSNYLYNRLMTEYSRQRGSY